MKYLRIPLSRWVIVGGIALGLLFGNDAIIALLSPLVNTVGSMLPAV